jgi:fructose/tagatose bisphosphate aldolase
MPLISEIHAVEALYRQAIQSDVCLANFCTANVYTTEAILRATYEFGQECGNPYLPIVISATANYPIEPQLVNYTHFKDASVGMKALIDDVELMLSSESPYCDLQVMLHFDHGQPDLDSALFDDAADKYATIMYDASKWPLAENIEMTRQFVQRMRGRVLVEGAVTEITQASAHADVPLTTVDEAQHFYDETGVFLIVPNLGTEHRATTKAAHYDSQRARSITERIGKRIVLHGSSSLQEDYLPQLANDGIVKVNVWTVFERVGGQAIARYIVNHLDSILPQSELYALSQTGILGHSYRPNGSEADEPKLEYLREDGRRDVWQTSVVGLMKFYLRRFNYARFPNINF